LNLYESPVAKSECTTQSGDKKGKPKAPSYLFVNYEIKGKTLNMAHMNSYFAGASIRHDEMGQS